jgi:hypothetical protein
MSLGASESISPLLAAPPAKPWWIRQQAFVVIVLNHALQERVDPTSEGAV